MSVVKTVKQRKSLFAALERDGKRKSMWWEHKTGVLQDWMQSEEASSDLQVEGAMDLIRSQVQRGTVHPHLRFKCWKHIVIELAALIEDDEAPRSAFQQGRRSSQERMQVQDAEALATLQAAQQDGDDSDVSASELEGLTFLERQELWLKRRKKSFKIKAILREGSSAENTFSPDISRSQTTLKPAQASAMEKKLEMSAVEAERVIRRKSLRADKEKDKENDSSKKETTTPKRRGSVKMRKGNRRATAPNIGQMKFTRPEELEEAEEAEEAEGQVPPMAPHAEDEMGESNGHEEETAPEKNEQDEEKEKQEAEDAGPTFEEGSFFSKLDKGKGHYRVRDASRFLLTSMYKRKDRVTRTPGVSLLVGKLEEPPHQEKVISAIFDSDRFTEENACEWWTQNGHRFEDSASLAEKEEMERKIEENKRTIQEAHRRYSAPTNGVSAALAAGVGASGKLQLERPQAALVA